MRISGRSATRINNHQYVFDRSPNATSNILWLNPINRVAAAKKPTKATSLNEPENWTLRRSG